MNRTYKTISALRLTAGVFSALSLTLSALPAHALDSQALPSGGTVVGGTATLDYAIPGELHVHQSTDRAVIDWDSFNIGAGALTQFHQPGANSITVNRVTGDTEPSQILGALKSNGIVMVLNRNGVFFGQDSVIDVGGIVASTGDIATTSFMADGRIDINNIATGASVINHGTINVADAGLAAFVAPHVLNHGVVTARLGRIQLASGDTATLDLYGDGLFEVAVTDPGIKQTLVNTGSIRADGGTIAVTTAAATNVVDSLIHIDGTLSAASATMEGGKIILHAADVTLAATSKLDTSGAKGGGTVSIGAADDVKRPANITLTENAAIHADATVDGSGGEIILHAADQAKIAGTLSAKGAGSGKGGLIETSGASVSIADTAAIDTSAPSGVAGTWLIDPTNFSIAAMGGNMTAAMLATQLALNNVIIETLAGGGDAGDIFVADVLAWTGDKTLSLRAHRNIDISAGIANSQGGSLILRADTGGTGTGTVNFLAGGSLTLSGGGRADLYYNPTAYTAPTNYSGKITGTHTAWMLVNDVNQLQAINTSIGGSYALARDIDASITATWNAGAGFTPIGSTGNFTGRFDGLDRTIANLSINRPADNYIALFGRTAGNATISNVRLTNAQIHGYRIVGGIAGRAINTAAFSNVHVTGTITGTNTEVGGLVGRKDSSGNLTGSSFMGSVSGVSSVGGLVGNNNAGTISNSFSTGTATGTSATQTYTGGNSGTIAYSFSTATITGANRLGGLVGSNAVGGIITDSYATGSVTSTGNMVGGLVGENNANITNSYSAGVVISSGPQVGGLTGTAGGTATVTSSYWNTDTSGHATSNGGAGLTTAQIMQLASFSGWDISDEGASGAVWRIYEGYTTPLLAGFLTPLTIATADVSVAYSGTPWNGTPGLTYDGFNAGDDPTSLLGTLIYGGPSQGATQPGTYAVALIGGLYSGQHGYDIRYSPGNLTIGALPPAPPAPPPPAAHQLPAPAQAPARSIPIAKAFPSAHTPVTVKSTEVQEEPAEEAAATCNTIPPPLTCSRQ